MVSKGAIYVLGDMISYEHQGVISTVQVIVGANGNEFREHLASPADGVFLGSFFESVRRRYDRLLFAFFLGFRATELGTL